MPLFTRENAATLGRKGAIARWTRPPDPATIPGNGEPQTQPDELTQARLARLRSALARLESRMIRCCHSRTMKELAGAYAALAEVERQLAGRPLPGSKRPREDRPARTDAAWMAEPLEISANVQPAAPSSMPAPSVQDAQG